MLSGQVLGRSLSPWASSGPEPPGAPRGGEGAGAQVRLRGVIHVAATGGERERATGEARAQAQQG